MSYFTIEDGPWPQGTTVAVWPAASVVGGVPAGAAVDAQPALPSGSVTFGGLTAGGEYVAFGHGGSQAFQALEDVRPEDVVRSSTSDEPYNADELYFATPGTDPFDDLDVNLTTPQRSKLLVSRYDDLDRLVSPNPGVYNWGIFGYEVNQGNAPVTAVAGRARGNTVYTLSSSGRAFGKDAQIHGAEITAGAFVSEATATATNGSAGLTGIAVTQDGKGSRFEAGMPVSVSGGGSSVPGGTTILSAAGRPGAPTSITLSNPVSGLSSSPGTVTVTALPSGTIDVIGLLVTGNWGTGSAASNGVGIQFQSQNAASAWQYGINFGASALLATGRAIRLASMTADRVLSMESLTATDGVVFAGGTYSNAGIYFTTPTMNYGMRFLSGGTYTQAAIALEGQHMQFTERAADPAAPAANAVRFYARDNGSGKTQLVARFATGAIAVLATEP